jgi:hypothetical protein
VLVFVKPVTVIGEEAAVAEKVAPVEESVAIA